MLDDYGDGWNDAQLVVNGVNYTVVDGYSASACVDLLGCNTISWDIGGLGGLFDVETSWTLGDIASGANGSGTGEYGDDCEEDICDGTVLTMLDSWGDGWNGAELVVNGVIYTIESGSSASACIDLLDCNVISWNSAFYDDETSWTLGDIASGANGTGAGVYGDCGVAGCTDESACNYNSDATTDDGSCTLPATGFDSAVNCDRIILTMLDSWGDGWNGAALVIDSVSYTIESGLSDSACFDVSGCLSMSWTSGGFDGETEWSLGDLASGIDGSIPPSVVGNGCVTACSDSSAVNYNPDADIADDSLCQFPATCDYALPLTGSSSSNTGVMGWFSFDMIATGSASVTVSPDTDFPEFIETTVYSDCETVVSSTELLQEGTYFVNVIQTVPEIGDVDFTISVDISITGCTDPSAANYDPLANVSGECTYIYGCTDPIAENFDEEHTTDDGSCEYIFGCMDEEAINFNPAATKPDDSCQFVECLQTSLF